MLRNMIAAFAGWRADRHGYLADWWSDIAVWITHADRWHSLRRRKQRLRTLARHDAFYPEQRPSWWRQ